MIKKIIILIVGMLVVSGPTKALTPVALGDSLTQYMGMPTCVPKVQIRSIQQRNGILTVRTNPVLGGKALDQKETKALKRQVALWVTGRPDYKNAGIREIRIFSGKHEIEELIVDHTPKRGIGIHKTGTQSNTERLQAYKVQNNSTIHRASSHNNIDGALSGANIALWASHGAYLYSDTTLSRWIWQRAKMWNTIEDRLTTEYTTRVSDMLTNAGAQVLMPRPDPRSAEGQEKGESGLQRWMEGAVYWLREQGLADTIVNYTKGESEYKNDLFCRPLWVNYLVDSLHTPIDYALALHTDGYDEPGDDAMVGTLALYSEKAEGGRLTYGDGRNRMLGRQAAHIIQHQLVKDMQALVDSQWPERRLRECSYVETRFPKVPSMILEIASHKDISDARYLLNPKCQDQIARAIYKGVARALMGHGVVITPLSPRHLGWTGKTLTWEETPDALEPTARAEYYIVTDNQGHSWKTRETSLEIAIEPGVAYEFAVTAYNDGGCSLPSKKLGVYQGEGEATLVVNAFNRVNGPTWYADSLRAGVEPGEYGIASGYNYQLVGRQTEYRRDQNWVSDDDCGWGMCTTEWQDLLTAGNSHDYHLQHGKVLAEMGRSYVALPYDGQAMEISSEYGMVDVILGQETEINETLIAAIRPWFRNTVNGHLLIAGAHIGKGAKIVLNPWNRLVCQNGSWSVETTPNERTLYCSSVRALQVGKGQRCIGFWRENGLPAVVTGERYTAIGCMLESIENWEAIYRAFVK